MPLLGTYLNTGADSGLPYEEEVLNSYEAGFKLSVGDNTRINGSMYFYDYEDYQAFLFVDVKELLYIHQLPKAIRRQFNVFGRRKMTHLWPMIKT